MKRVIKIIFSWILIISIPLCAVNVSLNVFSRLPDLYQYKMTSDSSLKSFGAASKEEAVAQSIGRYLQHRTDELQYQVDEEDELSLIFTRDEQNWIQELRKNLDISAVILLAAAVLTAISYILLIKGEHYEVIRIRFKIASGIYVVFAAAVMLLMFAEPLRENLWLVIFEGLDEGELLYSIFDGNFLTLYMAAALAVSTVIMGVGAYLTWKHTKPKRIFF